MFSCKQIWRQMCSRGLSTDTDCRWESRTVATLHLLYLQVTFSLKRCKFKLISGSRLRSNMNTSSYRHANTSGDAKTQQVSLINSINEAENTEGDSHLEVIKTVLVQMLVNLTESSTPDFFLLFSVQFRGCTSLQQSPSSCENFSFHEL